jgi:hypothetical protein
VPSLYRPDERTDVNGFFRSKFKTDECPQGHENIWRLALTAQVHDSYEFFASNFCTIANKAGELTTLKPFVGQAIHRVTLDSQLRAGLPGRLVEVKARQLGWTMENIARGLHYCLDENSRSMMLVDNEDVAQEQARRLGTMLNGLPGWMQPMRRIQNLKHLIFDNPNPKDRLTNPGLESAYQITVPASMRGVPQGFVCVSEYAFMDLDRQAIVQQGVFSAAPMTPRSIIIIDTTPNGMDDSYYEMVMEAVEDNPKWTRRIEGWKGELTAQDVYDGVLGVPDTVAKGYPGVYVPAICPWRLHPEYSAKSKATPLGELRPLTKAQRAETESTLGKLSKYGGDEETHLQKKYQISTERLFWRRRKIDGYKLPTEEMSLLTFRQEFLSDIESAFVDSGSAPFDRASMDALARQLREPLAVGLFRDYDKFDHNSENSWQQIRIYAPPQNGERYTMGVDTNVAFESPDSDASVAQVVRWRDNKIVATYEARVDAHTLLQQLDYLYRWYFNCYYAIETAGMGYQLIRWAIDKGMSNCHYYKRYDADYPEPTKFPGWETKQNTRPLMDQTFTALLCNRNRETGKAEPEIIIPDAKTQKEIKGLTRTPTGSFKSSRGHDDHYDALCIALCIARDPYSGLTRPRDEDQDEKRREFEERFYAMTRAPSTRNRPDLSSI